VLLIADGGGGGQEEGTGDHGGDEGEAEEEEGALVEGDAVAGCQGVGVCAGAEFAGGEDCHSDE